jgi:glycerol-3-phosphate dehydrogenase
MREGELDVLVVGGGIVGAGSALDAASRGLRVGVVEAQDWAAGTSSRSSKLIHGGLRYLQMLDFVLVREALRERAVLLRTSPHLVHPTPFLYPLRHRIWERAYVGSGVLLYDLLARSSGTSGGVPFHRQLSRRRALALASSLRPDLLVGAIQYYDAQVDDARHTLSVLRTAAGYGAHVANRVLVTGLVRDGDAIAGARLCLVETGEEIEVRARVVLSATGVWTETIESLAGRGGAMAVRPSKGIHLVVGRDKIRSETALILPTEQSVLFVLPWGEHWLVGTTDTEWDFDKARPAASAADVDYLLRELNSVLVSPLAREDVESVYVGLRPLIAGAQDKTTKLSREHAVGRPAPGLVVVSGGKYTTYRVMARDAVDAAVEHGGLDAPPSRTEQIGIVGAEGFAERWQDRSRGASEHGLELARYERLLRRYGSLVDEVLAQAPGGSLTEPLAGAPGYLRAEVVYAATHEGARHLEDVLARRTRAALDAPNRGLDAAEEVAALLAAPLGWDGATTAREVEDYRAQVAAERLAESMADDAAADATVRATAPLLTLP